MARRYRAPAIAEDWRNARIDFNCPKCGTARTELGKRFEEIGHVVCDRCGHMTVMDDDTVRKIAMDHITKLQAWLRNRKD